MQVSFKEKEVYMGKFNIPGNWNEKKGKLKKKYAKLTFNDLKYEEGREEELIGRIQKRLDITEEEAKMLIGHIFSTK